MKFWHVLARETFNEKKNKKKAGPNDFCDMPT